MDAYLARIARFPRLDADHERELARRAKQGDSGARDELITAHLGLVVARARRLGHVGPALLEAVQAGSEGLIEAVDRFDPERGSRLSSYAWWWIGDAMKSPRLELPSEDADSAISMTTAEPHTVLRALVAGMDDQSSAVLRERFGRWGSADASSSRRATAARLGLTPSQVRLIEGKAIAHLRRRLAKVGDRAPDERNLGGAGPL